MKRKTKPWISFMKNVSCLLIGKVESKRNRIIQRVKLQLLVNIMKCKAFVINYVNVDDVVGVKKRVKNDEMKEELPLQ